jgi:hypothetical protein
MTYFFGTLPLSMSLQFFVVYIFPSSKKNKKYAVQNYWENVWQQKKHKAHTMAENKCKNYHRGERFVFSKKI